MYYLHHIFNNRTINYVQFTDEDEAIKTASEIVTGSYQNGVHKVIVFNDDYSEVIYEVRYTVKEERV